jgi:hypothetical protein
MKKSQYYIFLGILFFFVIILQAGDSLISANSSVISIQHSAHYHGAVSQDSGWVIATNILARQPHWDGQASSLPLSQSNAISIALEEVKSHYPDIHDWKVENILVWNLSWNKAFKNMTCCSNVWYYLISIEPTDDKKGVDLVDSGQDLFLDQIVLMDGTLIRTEIRPNIYLQTPVMRDVHNVITNNMSGSVVVKQLPTSIVYTFGPKRGFVTNNVLVLYTSETNGVILNPTSPFSVPTIQNFYITPDNEPGVFNFNELNRRVRE